MVAGQELRQCVSTPQVVAQSEAPPPLPVPYLDPTRNNSEPFFDITRYCTAPSTSKKDPSGSRTKQASPAHHGVLLQLQHGVAGRLHLRRQRQGRKYVPPPFTHSITPHPRNIHNTHVIASIQYLQEKKVYKKGKKNINNQSISQSINQKREREEKRENEHKLTHEQLRPSAQTRN